VKRQRRSFCEDDIRGKPGIIFQKRVGMETRRGRCSGGRGRIKRGKKKKRTGRARIALKVGQEMSTKSTLGRGEGARGGCGFLGGEVPMGGRAVGRELCRARPLGGKESSLRRGKNEQFMRPQEGGGKGDVQEEGKKKKNNKRMGGNI